MKEFFNTNPKTKHTSINILKFLKNSFLLNSYLKIDNSHNSAAGKLFTSDYESFKKKAREVVDISKGSVYESSEDFTIKFSEFDSVHEKILNNLKERQEETLNDKVIGF